MFWETILEQHRVLCSAGREAGGRERVSLPGQAACRLLPSGAWPPTDAPRPAAPGQVGSDLWFMEVSGPVEKRGLRLLEGSSWLPSFLCQLPWESHSTARLVSVSPLDENCNLSLFFCLPTPAWKSTQDPADPPP